MRRQIPPFLWYREDHPGTVAWLGEPADYARSHGLSYFDFAGVDVSLGIEDKDSAAIVNKIASNPELQPLMQHGKSTVYAVRPKTSAELRTEPHPPAQ
jgi:hypothetical protein